MVALCLYDTRITHASVIDAVERSHRFIVTADRGRQPSAWYETPDKFVAGPTPLDPLESTSPALTLTDPTPKAARRAIADLGRPLLDVAVLDDLVLAVGETVSNAVLHGMPPVTVRAWIASDRLVTTVHDTGPGPNDVLAGLRPTTSATRRRSWALAHPSTRHQSWTSARIRRRRIHRPPPSGSKRPGSVGGHSRSSARVRT